MNAKRRLILLLAIAAATALLLFPPWSAPGRGAYRDTVIFLGYRFLSSPPPGPVRIEVATLLWPIAVVAVIALLACLEAGGATERRAESAGGGEAAADRNAVRERR